MFHSRTNGRSELSVLRGHPFRWMRSAHAIVDAVEWAGDII